MSGNRQVLPPETDARGLASSDPSDVAALVRTAFDGAAGLAAELPLAAPSRLDGWTVRNVLVHLGSWEEHRTFENLLADARLGRVHEVDDSGARNALVVAAHADAGVEEIVAALVRARDTALAFLTGPEAQTLGREWSVSPVGLLPVTGVIAAAAFELAVHALDVTDASTTPPDMLDAGVGALVDLTGALASRRGLRATLAVVSPTGSWAFSSTKQGWTTARLDVDLPGRQLGWPTVQGTTADLLDAAAGRRLAVQLLLNRRLRVYDVPGLLALLPALEVVPGLPGGSALRAAARVLAQTGRLVGRLGSLAVRR